MEGAGSPETEKPPRPGNPAGPDRGSLFALVVGIISLALVGGTTVAVLMFLIINPGNPRPLGPPEGSPPPAGGGSEPSPTPGAPDPEREKEMQALRDRILDLEIAILKLKGRIQEMEPEEVNRLTDRLLSGDPESRRGAQAILEQRGGNLGKVLVQRILALRERQVALESLAEVERGKAEAAVRELLAVRQKAAEASALGDKKRASAYYELGLKAQEQGHNGLAEEYYTKALDIDPALASSLNGRGMVRMALEKPVGALSDFTMAATLQPEFGLYHFNRGRALAHLKRWAEAEKAYERVLALDPANVEAQQARDHARKNRKQ
ncbi:MAG: tetratricopeptide repeat protein [Planctomycetota bacterium]|jgi:tetratricopeptide (TPR) repeat protein